MQAFVRNIARLLRGGAAVPPAILHNSPITYATDGLITSHTLPFDADEVFKTALSDVRSKVSHPCYHVYRLSIAVWCVQTVTTFNNFSSEDKLIELGVGEGITSLLVRRYFALKGKPLQAEFLLVDTFKGIDTRLVSAAEERSWGKRPRSIAIACWQAHTGTVPCRRLKNVLNRTGTCDSSREAVRRSWWRPVGSPGTFASRTST